MATGERCAQLAQAVRDAEKELERHLVTDEVGDTYPDDTEAAEAALIAHDMAFVAWAAVCDAPDPVASIEAAALP